jgi:hypothetical protein
MDFHAKARRCKGIYCEQAAVIFYFLSPKSGYDFSLLEKSSWLIGTIKLKNLCH